MAEPINGRELLAIRARAARAQQSQHQSLRQTEQDRHALVVEVYRLRDELAGHVDYRTDISIGEALDGAHSPSDAASPVSAATEAHGGAGEAEEGSQ